MEQKIEERSLQERIGLSLNPSDPATLVERLVRMEDAGVDHIWVGSPPLSQDLLTTLAIATARTTRLKLGTAIVQVFSHHPVHLAQQVLSFNSLAPGRLRLGIGSSSPVLAKNVYGIDMEDRPLSYLREYAQVLHPLLQQGEVHYQGHYFKTDASLSTASQVPLFLATLGPKSFRLAGEVADGALPVLCPVPYLLNTALPALQAGAAIAGRERPRLVAWIPVMLTEDRASALQTGRRLMDIYRTRPPYRNMFVAAGFSQAEIEGVSDSFVESLLVFGSESKVREHLLQLLSMGLDELTVSLFPISDATQEEARLARLIGQL